MEIDNLHVSYGQVEAVHGVSMNLDAGQIVTIIGANGAGKTTLMSAAIGLLPSKGRVLFEGEDISGLGVEEHVERGICLVPETRELFGEMSVLDNLLLGGFVRRRGGKPLKKLEAVYERFPRLAERRHQRASTLSGGERQMLALGRALMSEPRLLLLDEPSLGLAPLIVQEILEIVKDLRDAGVSILLVEQNALAALETSDYGYVLELGEVTLQGDSASLKSDRRVFASYLGED